MSRDLSPRELDHGLPDLADLRPSGIEFTTNEGTVTSEARHPAPGGTRQNASLGIDWLRCGLRAGALSCRDRVRATT